LKYIWNTKIYSGIQNSFKKHISDYILQKKKNELYIWIQKLYFK